ncbi:hypothetical protein L1D19_21755 [Vibrio natriegens]|uniref:hypothetical protein n=1 Tax=Vibrio natriegens TaxID=691 RepID=UPI001EFD23BA|nr:hypothetical protein [Vibrio natriegens]MCG9702696.1 hypothetical protein [Vibrio natriegens]
MRVEIDNASVRKTFKPSSNQKKRYKNEKLALLRLKGSLGFPQLLLVDNHTSTLTMTRLNGQNLDILSASVLNNLKILINNMLDAGVSKHSLPVRDILVTEEHNVSVVDFERVTLRRYRWSPIWLIAKEVTYFHLLRLIDQHKSTLLTDSERKKLVFYTSLRESIHQPLRKGRSILRKFWKKPKQMTSSSTYTKKFESTRSHKYQHQSKGENHPTGK